MADAQLQRDERVRALREFLQDAADDTDVASATVADEGLLAATALAAVASAEDIEAWYLIATLRWWRYLALPDSGPGADLRSALDLFARLLPVAEHLVPKDVREMLDRLAEGRQPASDDEDSAETWNDTAVRILQDPHVVNSEEGFGRAIGMLRRAAAGTDRDSPHRCVYLSNLCAALRTRFERTRVPADLDEAIAAGRDAVAATPSEDPDRPGRLSNLSCALHTRFHESGLTADLDEAIVVGREAVHAAQLASPDRAAVLSNLGLCLQTRFEQSGLAADLDEAVALGREAAHTTPAGHPDRSAMLSNLGLTMRLRHEHAGADADLAESIDASRSAVAATPPDHPDRAGYLSNLCAALWKRYERSGVAADMEQAIAMLREAVDVTPPDHPDRAGYLSNLGGAVRERFDRTGSLADLDEAIAFGEAAVQALPAGHPDLAVVLSTVGVTLRLRYERAGVMADLDAAIANSRDAVSATPVGHVDRAGRISNLANALRMRFDRTSAEPDLAQAIALGREAVAAAGASGADRATFLSNLGSSVRARFEWAGNAADLDEAVALLRDAAELTPRGHLDRAGRLTNLAIALHARFDRTGIDADLDAAVTAGREAVDATAVDHADRPMYLSNLGNTLRARFEHAGAVVELDEAVGLNRQAVGLTALDSPALVGRLSNLGLSLRALHEATGEGGHLDEAIDLCREAVTATSSDHPDRAMYLFNLGSALLTRSGTGDSDRDLESALAMFRAGVGVTAAAPLLRATAGRQLAELLAGRGDIEGARHTLDTVFELLPQLVDRRLGEADRRHHLAQLQGLGPLAAWTSLSAEGPVEDVLTGGPVDAAWSFLEAGRGVLLSQALDSRETVTQLRRSHPAIADEVQRLRALLNRAEPTAALRPMTGVDRTTRHVVEQRHDLVARWDQLMTSVRALSGHERFGLPPTAEQLRESVGEGTAVAVNVTAHGCGALILTAQGSRYLPLPLLTQTDVNDRAAQFQRAVGSPVDDTAATATVFEVLEWLWDQVTGPLLAHLRYPGPPEQGSAWPRIWWIPTGALTLMPLHAAGHHRDRTTGGRTVLDRVVSSYTPTVRALHQARPRPARKPDRHAVSVGLNSPAGARIPTLSSAEREAAQTLGQWQTGSLLVGARATRKAVTSAMSVAGWAHFACHAVADLDEPALSHLLLRDGQLTVAELNRIALPQAFLAYLSACSTATSSPRLADEAIHLAAAFQLTGYAHVIATLWPISDSVAPRSARHIYESLTAGVPPSLAVHLAVRASRDRHPHRPQAWAPLVHFGP